MKKRVAFTLAEVLITLTIIGVIAALTIPNLMQKWEDNAEISALKTAYSIIDNAIKIAIAENGPIDSWDWPTNPDTQYGTGNEEFFGRTIAKYLKVKTFCTSSWGYNKCTNYGHCESNGNCYFKKLANNELYGKGAWTNNGISQAQMVLENGMIVWFSIVSPTKPGTPNNVLIDTNGRKGPNKFGYDVFYVYFKGSGLKTFWSSSWTPSTDCNPTINSSSSGTSCAYWVMRKGNMDYKYRDISSEW